MTEIEEFWRKTGSAGGKKRATTLSPARRKKIAEKAALARWAKAKKEKLRIAKTSQKENSGEKGDRREKKIK